MRKLYTFVLSVLGVLMLSPAQALQLPAPLVESRWLADHQSEVMVLDVRKDLKSFTAKPLFVRDKKSGKKHLVRVGGHIPGAHLVDYSRVRTTRTIDGKQVTRMLPDQRRFEALMQAVGINKDSAVVITSKGENNGDVTMATRLYWQMKYYGHDNLAILNGGVAQWILDGRPVSSKAEKPAPGNWTARAERRQILATSDDVAAAAADRSAQLVDTRALSLYLGTWRKSYVYDSGHIPGAKVFPNELLTRPSLPARFLPAEELRQLATALGVNTDRNAITYCNSGHLASGSWFMLSELLGNKNVRLYDGSMHEWTLEQRPTVKLEME